MRGAFNVGTHRCRARHLAFELGAEGLLAHVRLVEEHRDAPRDGDGQSDHAKEPEVVLEEKLVEGGNKTGASSTVSSGRLFGEFDALLSIWLAED